MEFHPDNPAENSIPTGVSESELIAAITSSGYPLQGIVAGMLLPRFNVSEEWGFIDDDSNEHRSLDILAYQCLDDKERKQRLTGLELLIECKRSRHPFVFFQQVVNRGVPHFPHVHGVPRNCVSINDGGKLSRDARPYEALGLQELPFVAAGPPACAVFSKGTVNGKKVELSGTEPYNTIVLPLVKSLRHRVSRSASPSATTQIWPTMTLCVAVLDAPMLVVESPATADRPVLRPWVRVVRHESVKDAKAWSQSRFYAIDVVHASYLTQFLDEHVEPFAREFAERVARVENVLRYGGEVADLQAWNWQDVKPRPKPKG